MESLAGSYRYRSGSVIDMGSQVNVRLDDDMAESLDRIAESEGKTRVQVVREAIARRVDKAMSAEALAQHRRAFELVPETPEELARAEAASRRLTDEEPWEKWW